MLILEATGYTSPAVLIGWNGILMAGSESWTSRPRRPRRLPLMWRCMTSSGYQLAVQHGAFAAVAGGDARPGGAELVYLRLPEGDSGHPKTFQQASLDDVPFPVTLKGSEETALGEQPTWVHRRLADAAQIIRSEHHDARIGPACRYCPFRTSCPAQPAGQQVVR